MKNSKRLLSLLLTACLVMSLFTGMTISARAITSEPILYYVSPNGSDGTGTGALNAPYATIQAAINAVHNNAASEATTYIICVMSGTYSDDIQIEQQANKNIILQPANGAAVKLTGSITIDGNGADINGRTETLAIRGLTFDNSNITTTAGLLAAGYSVAGTTYTKNFIKMGQVTYSGETQETYWVAHNISIDGCNFKALGMSLTEGGTAYTVETVAVIPNATGNYCHKNVTISNCTCTGLHSLFQGYVMDLNIIDCTVSGGESGVNVNSCLQVTIDGLNFTGTGYGVRVGQPLSGQSSYAVYPSDGTHLIQTVTAVIKNSNLQSTSAVDSKTAVVLRYSTPITMTIQDSMISASSVDPIYGTGAAVNALTISGNYWNGSSYNGDLLTGIDIGKVNCACYYTTATQNGDGNFTLSGLTYTPGIAAAIGYAGYTTIQAAVSAAVNNDTIFIVPGTHAIGSVVAVNKNITITGPAFTEGGEPTAILDGGVTWSGSTPTVTNGVSIFSVGGNVIFRNLKLQNGYSTYGGAVSVSGTLNAENCLFESNIASTYYGSAVAANGSFTARNCCFKNNSFAGTSYGGAVAAAGNANAHVELYNCNFSGNKSNGNTAGVIFNNGSGTATGGVIQNCTFTNNSSAGSGAVYADDYTKGIHVTDSTFTGNSGINGGAIYTSINSPITITGCTFESNTAAGGNGGGATYHSGLAIITGCIYKNNTAINNAKGGGAVVFGSGADNSSINYTSFIGNGITAGGGSAGYGTVIHNSADNLDLSRNYWGGLAPTMGTEGVVQIYNKNVSIVPKTDPYYKAATMFTSDSSDYTGSSATSTTTKTEGTVTTVTATTIADDANGNITVKTVATSTDSSTGAVIVTTTITVKDAGGNIILQSTSTYDNKAGKYTAAIETAIAAADGSAKTIINDEILQAALSAKSAEVTVVTPVAKLVFDQNAIKAITDQSDGNVTAFVDEVDKSTLSSSIQQTVGTSRVFDFKVLNSKGEAISFDSGTITISIPYTLKAGETADTIKVFYINSAGAAVAMSTTYNAATGIITFTTSHFSYFAIMYAAKGADQQENGGNSFTDVSTDSWYYDAVEFVTTNGLFYGTTETTFEPEATMTRAMLVTVLWRLAGEPSVNGKSTFADVADGTWYSDAVVWATKNKIVAGYSKTTFGANNPVAREQLAAILYRYASYKGYNVTASNDLAAFTDAKNVSSWALKSMKWAVAEGLISGTTTATISPNGYAKRAEVASILMRFVENVVE